MFNSQYHETPTKIVHLAKSPKPKMSHSGRLVVLFKLGKGRTKQMATETILVLLTFNPLSPSILVQILQTDLHTFPQRISWKNLIKDHGIFSLVINLLILITYLLTVYGYCKEKIDLGHYWDLKG